ncbi:calcineurin-like phosphoesterase [Aureococcus anophagefferens]|nr:calcineurin-like phosphoesterase [Aureococcus anophagefferens]
MFGQINVRDDSTAHLTFSFVDSETSEPVVLERFYVTVFDIDQQRSENRHTERLCVDSDQYDEYVLRESASLVFEAQDTACDGSEGSSVTFQNDIGEDCDQCIDQGFDEYFPIDQAERSVMFVFRAPRSSFDLSYTLPCVDCFLDATTGFNGGRNFLFGGSSSLCVWPTPAPTSRPSDAPTRVPAAPTAVPTSSAPTTDDFYWHTCEDPFHDFSLENDVAGPGELLRFAAATMLDGAAVDLVVAAADGAAGDGVSGATRDKFGFVGVPDDARVDLELAFEDAGGSAVALRRFYVSVVDIDVEAGRREELCVDDGEYDEYVLGKNSSLSVEARDAACDGGPGASTVFAATEAGFSCDDPTNPMRLNTRGVMFVLREKRSAMRLSYAVACDGCEAGGASGMLFAGASSLCTFESEAWETCNDGDATLRLEGAELVSNNLGGAGPVFSDPDVLRYAGVVERTDDSPVDLVHRARLRFSFVDAATDLAVGLERFYVTIFDIDQQRKPNRHREMLCIDDDQYEDYVLGGDPTLDVSSSPRRCDGSAGSSSTSFLSTAAGFICDNPSGAASDPLDLGTVVCAECDQCVAQGFDAYFPINQADRSVMFTFEKERMSFDLSYTLPCEDCFLEELTGFNGGRNFLFGGESSLCAWPTMAPTAPAWVTCSGSDVALEIEGAELVANNLGGAGPAFGDEPVLRYADVWRGDGSPVDLVVSVQEGTDYAVADDYANYQGLWNQYGQINVRDNSTAHLVFSFVDSATERPVALERFYFTIFDIDQQRNENRHREMLCAASASTKGSPVALTSRRAGIDDDQYDDYVLGGDPTLEISRRATRCDGSAGASTTFLSTAAGFECDNPQVRDAASFVKCFIRRITLQDPQFLGSVACEDCDQCVDQGFDEYFPIDQADRSVMFTFREARDSFTLSYTLPCVDCFLDATTGFNGGRNFLFGGESSLCAWPTPAPTAPADAWPACDGAAYDFDLSAATLAANDLGGAGPDAGDAPVIRYAGATVKDARPVDLEVSAVGEYLPADDLAGQGLDGAVGRVSVRDNSTARLRFAFKDGYDGGSVDLAEFYVTFLDLDGDADPRRHRETLCVDDDAFDDYVVSENSELAVTANERRCDGSRGTSVTFSSTAAGFDCDDAAAPEDLELVTCARCDECAAEGLDAFFPVDQRDRAVMLVFREPRASFEVSYGVPCLDCLTPDLVGFHGGRHASFAGASSLCSWPTSAPTLSPKPSTRPTDSASSEAQEVTVLVAGAEVRACPLSMVLLSGLAATAAVGAVRARVPMVDKYHRENNRAFFWASLLAALAHSTLGSALLLRLVGHARRRDLLDGALMGEHRSLFAAVLVFATTHKADLGKLLPWRRTAGAELYDVEHRDGTVERRVGEELLRQREKMAAAVVGGGPAAADAVEVSSDDEPPADDGRPLKRGARVEARYAGGDDLYFRGRVVAVSPAGDLFDVRYDHGETEACVHRSRLRRVSGFEAGAVVDYQAPEGSWRRCKVVKARGRRGSAAENFGYPSSALFAAATASTVIGCAAQLAVKVAAVAYGRRDAVTVINLSSNACTMLYALLSVLRLARSRLYRRRGRKATAHDTGVEIWRLVEALVVEDDDDDKKPAVRDAIEDAEAIRIDFEAESPAKNDLTCGCGPAAM